MTMNFIRKSPDNSGKRVRRSSLLLTETMIAILFFAIIAAIALLVFSKARTVSYENEAGRAFVNDVNSIDAYLDEEVQSFSRESADSGQITLDYSNIYTDIAAHFPSQAASAEGLTIYYDSDFAYCDEESAVYYLTMTGDSSSSVQGGSMATFQFSMNASNDDKCICSSSISKYFPLKGGAHEE